MALNAKQRAFVQEYLKDKNGTQAAIRAGYSKRTARQIAEELLSKPDIRAEVDAALQDAAERNGLTVDLLLSSLVREITFDPADLFNEDGSLKAVHEMPADARKVLSEVTITQIGGDGEPARVTKVKWTQPNQARDQGMRYLGMYDKDNAQKGQAIGQIIRRIVDPSGGD